MKNYKRSTFALSILIALLVSGCDTNNRDMRNVGVSKLVHEGCNYLVFKKQGDYGNSVVLDPKNNTDECRN
jgi:hypothetical protein